MHHPIWIRGLLCCVVFILMGNAPANAQNETDIEELKRKIQLLEAKLHEQNVREAELVERLEILDEKISLSKNLLHKLQQEIEARKIAIDSLRALRAEIVRKMERLKSVMAKRMVGMYKYGRISLVEMLFRVQSLQEMRVWVEYQRRLTENDARNIQNYKRQQETLQNTQQAIEEALQKRIELLALKKTEQARLQKDRAEKKRLLKTIRKDRRHYRRQIENYQKAIAEIQKLIASSEEERNQGPSHQAFAPELDFAGLKGKLPWPVKGEVVRHYGPYKHPVLKTVTNNLGIDIRVDMGAEVQAVAEGRVTAITWQRGRGNLIIINHGGGYYTVYTHLDEIYVDLQQIVQAGDIIGRIGESGTFEFPVLHFQVWHKFTHLDPMAWLSK